jgi:hypothetical protein
VKGNKMHIKSLKERKQKWVESIQKEYESSPHSEIAKELYLIGFNDAVREILDLIKIYPYEDMKKIYESLKGREDSTIAQDAMDLSKSTWDHIRKIVKDEK